MQEFGCIQLFFPFKLNTFNGNHAITGGYMQKIPVISGQCPGFFGLWHLYRPGKEYFYLQYISISCEEFTPGSRVGTQSTDKIIQRNGIPVPVDFTVAP